METETAIISARGEAEAVKVRGDALRMSPVFLRLKLVERWNGTSPLVVPADQNSVGAGLLLPLGAPPRSVPRTYSPHNCWRTVAYFGALKFMLPPRVERLNSLSF